MTGLLAVPEDVEHAVRGNNHRGGSARCEQHVMCSRQAVLVEVQSDGTTIAVRRPAVGW